MRQALKIHPDSRGTAVTRIDVEAARRRPGLLTLRYVVTGRIDALLLPPVDNCARTDELWRHTCFEAFLRPSVDTAYREFNLAPSTQWAAYRFDGYRSGMCADEEAAAPRVETSQTTTRFELRASLALSGVPDDAPWRLGLSAVIEETGGAKSYWALAHPPGQADFHHSDCFALELAAA